MKRLLLWALLSCCLTGQARPANDGEELFSIDSSGKFRTNPAAVLPFYALPEGHPGWRTVGDMTLAGMPEYRVRLDAFEDPDAGFNSITILRNEKELLSLRSAGMWTYLYDGKCMIDLRRFTGNRCFIQEKLSDGLTLLIFVGWPYASDPSLLTIVALSGDEAAVIYNRYADIVNIFRTGTLFGIDVQKAVIEYDEQDRPCSDGAPCRIYYADGRLREVPRR